MPSKLIPIFNKKYTTYKTFPSNSTNNNNIKLTKLHP